MAFICLLSIFLSYCFCDVLLWRVSLHAQRDIVLPVPSLRPSVCPSVCLSVCLSNAGTVSKLMDISSHFIRPAKGVILVFFYPCHSYKIPRGDLNTRGYGKILQASPFISETARDKAIWNTNRKS